VIDGRPELLEEARATSDDLRAYLAREFDSLLRDSRFIDALPGHLPPDTASFSTVHPTLAQMGPPMLNVAAARGFFTCNSAGALPSSCSALQPIMAIPGRADRVALGDQPAGRVDAALAIRAPPCPPPSTARPALRRLADHLRADRAHHREAVVHFGHVHVLGLKARHP
jgi:hypothetical protein